jgi:hypothetical protein
MFISMSGQAGLPLQAGQPGPFAEAKRRRPDDDSPRLRKGKAASSSIVDLPPWLYNQKIIL